MRMNEEKRLPGGQRSGGEDAEPGLRRPADHIALGDLTFGAG